ncbi:MAG TPA: hypothetical protein VGF84_05720 [Micromonosporaceae bacterium]
MPDYGPVNAGEPVEIGWGPGQPSGPRWSASTRVAITVSVTVLALLIAGGVAVSRHQSARLASAAARAGDSGVNQCKAMLTASTTPATATPPTRTVLLSNRMRFAASTDHDLRAAGTAYIDAQLRMQRILTDGGASVRDDANAVTAVENARNTLYSTCAIHGVGLTPATIPAVDVTNCDDLSQFLATNQAMLFTDQQFPAKFVTATEDAIGVLAKVIDAAAQPERTDNLKLILSDYRRLHLDLTAADPSYVAIQTDQGRINIDTGAFTGACHFP